jgi:hypothetical protein
VAYLATMVVLGPREAGAQVNQCDTECCYCDLAAGRCKDISQFPGGGTGYTNCNVSGMTCNYWGTTCNASSIKYNEVGPDGVVISRIVAEARVQGGKATASSSGPSVAARVVSADARGLLRDCRAFVVGVAYSKPQLAAAARASKVFSL